MRSILNQNFKNKRVLLRVDFNVPLKRGKIFDDFKIKRALPTINHLINQQAKIILLSHLGQPKPGFVRVSSKDSLKPIASYLSLILRSKVKFYQRIKGKRLEKITKKLKPGQVILLENVRFDKGEINNDLNFAKELAKLADVYVNEALSVCHRKHASITLLPTLLPAYLGLDFENEYNILQKIKQEPSRPFVCAIGGAKFESKLKVVKHFLEKSDAVLLGGKTANILLTFKGYSFNEAIPQWQKRALAEFKNISLTSAKLHLPLDVIVSPKNDYFLYQRTAGPAAVKKEEAILDIGPETTKVFAEIISEAKAIFWSGVFGFTEYEKYSQGTKEILKAIITNKQALKVAGGGETIAFIRKYHLENRFDFLLTGGGSTLDFLAGNELPGIKALK
ncbi:phosphoglycerate kinase [Candidatus Gribaldobacteria bacterium]|nr:phosphoglycerate kinase [Candidatus Gribaldobacteria bacterium]